MQGNIRSAAFEKSMQAYYSLTILIICKKNKNIININIVSIFITLTEINNETHYVAKKKKKKKYTNEKTQKKPRAGICTLSVNLQGSRSSDYTITAMVQ